MSKLKIFGIILIVILFMCISFLILKFSFKDMNKQNNKESITETTIDISDLTENNNEKVDTIITNQMEDTNKLTSRFKVLNKYSEKYVSVAEWMIQEICYSMHTNGFTVTIEDETLGWKTVDGLEVYENAEQYVTEYLNSDKDLDSLFQTYCNEYYEELSKIFILGKEENEEYSEYSSQNTYEELIKLYYEGEYEVIKSEIENLMNNYKFTLPHNYKICKLYQDVKSAIQYNSNLDAINYGLAFVSLPETFFSDFLKLEDTRKLEYIQDSNSYVPFSNTKATFIDIKELDEIEKESFMDKYPKLVYKSSKVYKINCYILDKNETYEAYIYNDLNTFKVIQLNYTGTKTSLYKTKYELNNLYYGIPYESNEEIIEEIPEDEFPEIETPIEETIEETETTEEIIEETEEVIKETTEEVIN